VLGRDTLPSGPTETQIFKRKVFGLPPAGARGKARRTAVR